MFFTIPCNENGCNWLLTNCSKESSSGSHLWGLVLSPITHILLSQIGQIIGVHCSSDAKLILPHFPLLRMYIYLHCNKGSTPCHEAGNSQATSHHRRAIFCHAFQWLLILAWILLCLCPLNASFFSQVLTVSFDISTTP